MFWVIVWVFLFLRDSCINLSVSLQLNGLSPRVSLTRKLTVCNVLISFQFPKSVKHGC